MDKVELTRRAVIGGLAVAGLASGGGWYLHRLRHPGRAPLGMDLSADDRADAVAFLGITVTGTVLMNYELR